MSRLTRALLGAPICLFAFSASHAIAQTIAFQADFNLDTVGEEPNLDPPGEPSGDEIIISTSGGILTVMQSFGAMTDKPVVLDRRSSGSLSLQAILDPDLRSCNTYLVRWTSMLTEATNNVTIGVYSETSLMGAMYYREGGVLVYNGLQNPLETGYAPNVPQTFELSIDIPSKTTSLSIDGYADPNSQNLPFVLLNSTETFRRLYITLGGFDYEEFALDDIEIIVTGCNVPTNKTTWSSVKSRYE